MASASLDLNFNVTIKVVDAHGHIKETRHVHNRATRPLIDGIIQFLQGAFTPSEFNNPYEKYSDPEQTIINNALSAKRYIPSCTGVGICGIVLSGDTVPSLETHKLAIDEEQQIKPHFYESSLQIELPDVPRVKFKRVRCVTGQDQNNAEVLVLTTVLPKGYLVVEYENGEVKHDESGQVIYRENYFDYYGTKGTNPVAEKAMAITEVGLFSNTDTGQGLMLARVLLDGHLKTGYNYTVTNGSSDPINIPFGDSALVCPVNKTVTVYVPKRYSDSVSEQLDAITGVTYNTVSTESEAEKGVMEDEDYQYNPLIQTKDTAVIIEWRIGVISIGTNDEFTVISDQDPDVPIEVATDSSPYEGPYETISNIALNEEVPKYLDTTDKVLSDNITVKPIPANKTYDEETHGYTVSINS